MIIYEDSQDFLTLRKKVYSKKILGFDIKTNVNVKIYHNLTQEKIYYNITRKLWNRKTTV